MTGMLLSRAGFRDYYQKFREINGLLEGLDQLLRPILRQKVVKNETHTHYYLSLVS